jgi:type I restriction enzyme S subunit
MSNKLVLKPLKSLAIRIFSGAPLYSISKLQENSNGVPIVNIKDINDGQILTESLPVLSINDFKNAEHYMIYPEDVLIACRGTQLKSVVVPDNVKKLIITSNLISIRLSKQILPSFLVAYFNTQQGQRALLANATATVQLTLTVSDLGKIIIPVPPLSLQERIVNLFNTVEKQYRLNLESANLRKAIANQAISDVFKEYQKKEAKKHG